MERKSSKEYKVVFVMEGEKFKLRKLPSSRRRDCPVLKHSRVSEVFKGLTYMILSITLKEITI